MATVTKPIVLDESFHTTDGNNTNIADVLARLIDVISSNVITTTEIPHPSREHPHTGRASGVAGIRQTGGADDGEILNRQGIYHP